MDPALAMEIAAMSRQRALLEEATESFSETREFYRGCTVFLTGGSGFMGKQLIEKLFRSCKITKLFMLIRPKKGKTAQERLQAIFEDPVFEPVRKHQPDFVQRIMPVEGDASTVRLGLSDGDWETITREVSVIYHLAATTRFDEVLKTATFINVRGTREVIRIAKECVNLKSLVHVSSTYAHARTQLVRTEVLEQFHPAPVPPALLLRLAETMDEDRFNSLTEPMIKGWPNTYTFTKAVAEELIRTTTAGLPVCIVRPGIVVSAYREPMPGWLDMSCAYGASGLFIGIGIGVIHCLYSHGDTRLGIVPCDYVNNAIITAGKEAASNGNGNGNGGDNTNIYVVNSIVRNPLCFDFLSLQLEKSGRKYVSPKALYYNFLYLTPNKLVFNLITILSQLIPAYIADFISLLMGKERRFVKLCKKVNNSVHALSYFTLNDWEFVDDNLAALHKKQTKTDKLLFNFDISDVDWEEYCIIWGIGLRKYIVKDGLRGTEDAIKRQVYLKALHYVICALYLYVFWKIVSVTFSVASNVIRF